MNRQAKLSGLSFSIKDFVSPQRVDLDKEDTFTNQDQVSLNWPSVSDFMNTSEPIYYLLKINNKEIKVNDNQYILDTTLFTDGLFPYLIKACDSLDNCSDWSQPSNLIIDKTIAEYSHSFDGVKLGMASITSGKQGDVLISDDGVWTVSNQNSNNFWDKNFLELELNKSERVPYQYFEYKTDSVEDLAGFDQTKLIVTIDDEIVFIESNKQEEWQKVFLELDNSNLNQSVRFYSGNQGDNIKPSFAIIRNISTEVIPISMVDKIGIESIENNLSLTKQVSDNYLEIEVQDLAGNVSQSKVIISGGKVINNSKKIELQKQLGIVH